VEPMASSPVHLVSAHDSTTSDSFWPTVGTPFSLPSDEGTASPVRNWRLILLAHGRIVTGALQLDGAARWRGRTSSPKPTCRGLWCGCGGSKPATASLALWMMSRGSGTSFREPDATGHRTKRFPNGSSGSYDFARHGLGNRGASVFTRACDATSAADWHREEQDHASRAGARLPRSGPRRPPFAESPTAAVWARWGPSEDGPCCPRRAPPW
jgi:hypothetical protein